MPLFDDWERTDAEPMRHLETIIPFLDLVDRPYFARARALVNDWTDCYPASSRDRLITRLQSESTEQQLAAFWELYIHEVMRAAGWNTTVDPSVPGTNNVPDFLAVRGDHALYVEATSSNRSAERVADDNRLARLMDELAKLGPSEFRRGLGCVAKVRVEARGMGILIYRLSSWGQNSPGPRSPGDWRRGPDGGVHRRPHHPHAAGFHGQAQEVRTEVGAPLRARLPEHERVASKRRHSPPCTVGPLTGGSDGCWYARGQPVNRDIAAVIAVWNLMPTRVLGSIPAVFLNPWATTPLSATLPWPTVEFDPAAGSTTETDLPIPLAQLLGISEEFDGRGKPFDDD
jgi:hypothetical protein